MGEKRKSDIEEGKGKKKTAEESLLNIVPLEKQEMLVLLVRENSGIWDIGSEAYRKRNAKLVIWNKICDEVGLQPYVTSGKSEIDVAKDLWRSLTDKYRYEKKKLRFPGLSEVGCDEVQKHFWPLFPLLHGFLVTKNHAALQQLRDESMGEPLSSLPAIEMYNEMEQDLSSNRNKMEVCTAGPSRASLKFINSDSFLMEGAVKVEEAEESTPESSSQVEPPVQADSNKSACKNFPSGHASTSHGCPSCQVLGGKLGFAETRTQFLEMKLNQFESKIQWTESENQQIRSQNQQIRNQCEELQSRLLACQQKTINYLESCAGENSNQMREMLQEILQSTYV